MKFDKSQLRFERVVLDFDALHLYQKMNETGQLGTVFYDMVIDQKDVIDFWRKMGFKEIDVIYYKEKTAMIKKSLEP